MPNLTEAEKLQLVAAVVSTPNELMAFNRDFLAQKALFFIRRLRLATHRDTVLKLLAIDGRSLDWSKAGVERSALEALGLSGCPPGQEHLYFAHHDVLTRVAGAVDYYRNLITLSRKSAGRFIPMLSRGISAYTAEQLDSEIRFLNQLLNEILADVHFGFDLVEYIPFVTIGATLDGTWRDASGDLQSLEVASILCDILGDHIATVSIPGEDEDHSDSTLRERLNNAVVAMTPVTAITLRNGTVVAFPANPDLVIRDVNGTVLAGGEIKGATDPANVWERWPLVVKTLGEFHIAFPKAATLFFGLCVTRELTLGLDRYGRSTRSGIVQMLDDGILDYAFNFYRVRSDPAERDRLRGVLLRICGIEL